MIIRAVFLLISGIVAFMLLQKASLQLLSCFLILSLPIDRYIVNISGIPFGLSIFRILAIASVLVFLIRYFQNKVPVYRSPIYFYGILFLIGLMLSMLRAEFSERTLTIIRISITGFGIMILFSNVFTSWEGIKKAIYSLIGTTGFYIFFAFYTYYQGFRGAKVQQLPFIDIIPLNFQASPHLAGGKLFISEVGQLQRLSLPTGSPPRLSIFLSINAILILSIFFYHYLYLEYQGRGVLAFWSGLFFIASAMVFLTMARTGALAFISGLFFYFLLLRKDLPLRKVIILLMIFLIIVGIVIISVDQVQVIVYRLTSSTNLSRHWETRMEALSLWTENVQNLLLGIGLSDYEQFYGVHSHSAYTTSLAERGILGFVMYWMLFFYIFLYLLRATVLIIDHKEHFYIISGLLASVFVILLGSLLYEFMHEFTIWITFGVAGAAVGVDYRERRKSVPC